MGSNAYFTSYFANTEPRNREPIKRTITIGWDQGRLCPPRLRAPRRETMVAASMKAPAKSIRRSFDGSPLAGAGGLEDGSFMATRKMATRIRGV